MSARHRIAQAESLEQSADDLKKRLDAIADDQQELERLEDRETQARARVEEHGASLETLRVLAGMKAPLFELLAPASLPDHHEGGKRRVAAALVLFLGLALGFVIALVRAVRDTRILEPEDVDGPGSPVLATIVTSRRGKRDQRAELRHIVQAIRRARGGGERMQVLLLTSALESEGKTEARDHADPGACFAGAKTSCTSTPTCARASTP